MLDLDCYRPKIILLLLIVALIEYDLFPRHQSGFYCNDPKISFKFEGDTVTMGILLSCLLVTPLVAICVVELNEDKRFSNEVLQNIWRWYRDYMLGFMVTLVITEVAKVIVGEPRPHFLDTCRPDTGINCTTQGYIPHYRCTNQNIKYWIVSDSSRSFPSGHASLSTYYAAFCVWYVQKRITHLPCYLVKPFLQILFVTVCATSSLSRITDHRHHWWDVCAGAVLGVICSIYTLTIFCQNFRPYTLAQARSSHSTCTLLTDTTNKNATSVVL